MCSITALAVSSVASGLFQFDMARDQAKATEQVAANNAKIQDYRTKDAVYRGELREQRHRQNVANLKADQKVAIAGNGFEVGAGTALDTLLDTAEQGEIDAMIIRGDTQREIYGGQVSQQSLITQGQMDSQHLKAQGTASLLTSGIQAGSYYVPRP